MKTKEAFHKLIDEINDENTLKAYYEMISELNKQQNEILYKTLTDEEKQELMTSYEESFNSKNLINHEDVKSQHSKWLEQ